MSFAVHPWLRLDVGLVLGCWIGVLIGCGLTLVFAGRRLRQLQTANLSLRLKLRSKEKTFRRGSAPTLVVPAPARARSPIAPLGHAAGGR
jgi:hypothetical protein